MQFRTTYIRQWEIRFVFGYDTNCREGIVRNLLWCGAPESIIERVSENVEANRPNEGFTYSNPALRRSVVGVGWTNSGPEFLDSTVHEIFHLAQDMASTDGIPLYGEDIAYLAGDISHSVSDIICEMSCPHCRNL